jgi:large subunit ribosomal protein L1
MPRRGKSYLASLEEFDRDTLYRPREAFELVKKMAKAKFDETVEVHMRLGIDPRQAEQQIRSAVVMPAGLGKEVTILFFAEGEAARIAEQAGADLIGDDEMIERINGGFTDFDVAYAVPEMMRKIGRLGRVLGPRGLMPNPKAGTVVPAEDLPRVISDAKAGRVEFRLDKTANIHVPIGKTSFSEEKLTENLAALMTAIKKAKPAGAKGTYIRRITLSSTMGPGIKLDALQAQNMDVVD